MTTEKTYPRRPLALGYATAEERAEADRRAAEGSAVALDPEVWHPFCDAGRPATPAREISEDDRVFAEGRAAGLDSPNKSILCPYDGRTLKGKEWWRGFMFGDQERCAKARREAA